MNIFFREPPGQLLLESDVIFDVLCRCYYLYNFKNDRNTHWVLLSVKPQPSSMALYSNTLSWVFSRFFKLCKWYQIVQSMTDSHKLLFIKIVKPWCSKFVYSFIVKLGSMVKLRSSHPEFLEIPQNSQENACDRVSFLIKLQVSTQLQTSVFL